MQSSFVSPSITRKVIRSTAFLTRSSTGSSERLTPQSSHTSCSSIVAITVSSLMPMLTALQAIISGCTIYGSPLLRSWPECLSRAKDIALSVCFMPAPVARPRR